MNKTNHCIYKTMHIYNIDVHTCMTRRLFAYTVVWFYMRLYIYFHVIVNSKSRLYKWSRY